MAENQKLDVCGEETTDELLLECPLCKQKCQEPKMLACKHWLCSQCCSSLEDSQDKCPICEGDQNKEEGSVLPGIPTFGMDESNFEETLAVVNKAKDNKVPMCRAHSEVLLFYCYPCEAVLCNSCMTDHTGSQHSTITIDEGGEELMHRLRENLIRYKIKMEQQLMDCEQYLKLVDNAKEQIKTDAESKKEAIHKHGELVTELVQSYVQEMKKEIDEEGQRTLERQRALQEQMRMELSQLTNAANTIRESMHGGRQITDEELEECRRLLEELNAADQEIPEMNMTLELPDISKLTGEDLIGTVECRVVHVPVNLAELVSTATTCIIFWSRYYLIQYYLMVFFSSKI